MLIEEILTEATDVLLIVFIVLFNARAEILYDLRKGFRITKLTP